MNLETLRIQYKNEILKIADECMAENIRVFGSVARGDAREDSAVDFLVHMKPGSGFGIGGLQWRLEEPLGCRVDVISDGAKMHPLVEKSVLQEVVKL